MNEKMVSKESDLIKSILDADPSSIGIIRYVAFRGPTSFEYTCGGLTYNIVIRGIKDKYLAEKVRDKVKKIYDKRKENSLV